MNLHRRAWRIVPALLAALVAGCAPNENVVACHSDLSSRPADTTGLTITYSGEDLSMEVIAPDGSIVQPVEQSEISIDTGPATLADMGSVATGTYVITMTDTTGARAEYTFQAIVAERQVTRVRLICQ